MAISIAETTTQKCQSTTPTTKPSVAKPSSAFTESPSLNTSKKPLCFTFQTSLLLSLASPTSNPSSIPSLSPPISPLSASIPSNSSSPPTSVPLSKQPMTGFPSLAPPLPWTPFVVPISPPVTPVLPLVFEFKTNF
ncbi:hypothetical protein LOK49_LG10G01909 [Camellia lanceoleosa]|uniref:Uncharacterized protein n=1 Tax=Camellia lanceoleosa TaxID=1840588 RepID=A0ACC0GC16_9ERIC|nr:hypothetical protein LOK49_LG10G01909 [Camellia lanceoleosa]